MRNMHGVVAEKDEDGIWHLDVEKTETERENLRKARLSDSVNVEDWWRGERDKVQKIDFNPEVKEMYEQSLSFEKFRNEFCSFWQVDENYLSVEG